MSNPGLAGVSQGCMVRSSRVGGELAEASQAPGNFFRSDRARSKDAERGTRQVEDRRLQAEGSGPAVEDQVDPAIQVGQDVLGPGRRKPVRAIGTRRRERLAHPFDQASCDRWQGDSQATVSRPPVTTSGIRPDRVSTRVNGPGQNVRRDDRQLLARRPSTAVPGEFLPRER